MAVSAIDLAYAIGSRQTLIDLRPVDDDVITLLISRRRRRMD